MEYDPSQFVGSAPFYLAGRPAYSRGLGAVLSDVLGLDGTGVLVDVGAGPGSVSLALGSLFERIVVVEPDPEMLAEARRNLTTYDVSFHQATAEDLPDLGLVPARVIAFGQSFHRVDRARVAEFVHDLLDPGGAMVLIGHDWTRPPTDSGPGEPPIPHHEIRDLVRTYAGGLRSGAREVADYSPAETFAETVARTSFGRPEVLHAPGRPDIVRDVDGVIAGVRSMSYATPATLGENLEPFLAALRALLEQSSPSGRFWDWPGDTEIIVARKR